MINIEDAGFEIRDQIMWLYGSGFPKSLDISKAIDKAAGVERDVISEGDTVRRMRPGADQNKTGSWEKLKDRTHPRTVEAPATPEAKQWDGWGTALKPAHEPICVARKPLIGTVAENVLQFGTGGINIDGCRIPTDDQRSGGFGLGNRPFEKGKVGNNTQKISGEVGRWPAGVQRVAPWMTLHLKMIPICNTKGGQHSSGDAKSVSDSSRLMRAFW